MVPVNATPDKGDGRAKRYNARAEAAAIIHQVLDRGSSLSSLRTRIHGADRPDSSDALVQELCYGTLRWYPRLQYFAARLLERPFKKRDGDLYALILVGLYQLLYLDKPAHAVVNETVSATDVLGKSWARGVVNAVLRNCQRRGATLAAEIDIKPEARWAHPDWLLQAFMRDWPAQWQAIAQENNRRPPMALRINRQRLSREAYLEQLRAAGIPAVPVAQSDTALILEQPIGVERLPGFSEGLVSVQDVAAQMAAGLLDPLPGQRVLDACAAPGGKTCHLLESQSQIAELVALDHEPARLRQVEENLNRLGLRATLKPVDAAATDLWWDGRMFDRILLDAPCSATGVIRRHPDIKILRRPADIDTLVVQQAHLLHSLWPLLAPGGMLLYATCSVLARENHEQIVDFLRSRPDAREMALPVRWGLACPAGRQILPGESSMDGFYYALLKKESA